MTISYIGAGTPTYSTSNPTPDVPAHLVGDLIILAVGTKPDTTPATTPAGWTLLGATAGGTGSTGIDTGPMRVGIFYKIATTTSESPGTITITGNNVSAAQTFVYRKTQMLWDIAGTGAADTSTGSPHSAVMPLNPGLTVSDELFAIGVIPTDVTTPSQFSAQTVSATGMTTVNLTELVEWDTSSGQDMGGWIARGPVVTGTATAAPTVSATAGGTTTNVAGPIFLVRIREMPNPSSSDSGSISAVESASVVQIVSKSASDSGTLSATDSGSKALMVPGPPPTIKGSYNTVLTSSSFQTISNISVTAGDKIILIGIGGDSSLSTDFTVNLPGHTFVGERRVGSSSDQPVIEVFRGTAQTTTSTLAVAFARSGAGFWCGTIIVMDGASDDISFFSSEPLGYVGVDKEHDNDIVIYEVAETTGDPISGWTKSEFTSIVRETEDPGVYALGVYYVANQPAEFYSYGATSGTGAQPASGVITVKPALVAEEGGSSEPIAGSDSGTILSTESASVSVATSLSDTASVGATESVSLFKTSAVGDSGSISGSESQQSSIASSINDTGMLSSADTASLSIFNTLSVNDAGSVTSTESAVVQVTVSTSDSGIVSSTDTSASSSTLSRVETGTISATDTSLVFKSITASDTGSVSSVESAQASVQVSTQDTGSVSVVEDRSISSISNVVDVGSIGGSESATMIKSIAATESGSISATETAVVFNDRLAADSGIISTTESSSIDISGVIEKTANDTGSWSSLDQSVSSSIQVSVSESGAISATESSTVFKAIASMDDGSITSTESTETLKTVPTTDSGSLSSVESGSVVMTTGAPVKVWNGVEMLSGQFKVWNGTAFVSPTIRKWTGSGYV